MNEMFCFQCQQTAHNTGCTGKAGVCGKKADTANNQDDLIGALRSDIPQCMLRRTCIFRGETRARHRLKSFPDCGTTHSACCTL